MQINIFWVGKTKNSSIRALSADYLERLRHLVPCKVVEIRDLSRGRGLQGNRLAEAEGNEISRFLSDSCRLVALDENGTEFTSPGFARWFESEQNRGTKEIACIIGGVAGLSAAICEQAHLTLSLGKMTWTHEMCRALLLEQIYRAFCILRRIPYHK